MQSSIIILIFLINITVGIFISAGDLPAGAFIFLIIGITLCYAIIGKYSDLKNRLLLCNCIILIYVLSSIITSSCFSEKEFFLASDPMRYIETVHGSHSIREVYDEIEKCYMNFADNNGLYNAMLRYIGVLCYKNRVNASSLLITLPQTLFGILTIQTIYRILRIKFKPSKSFKYAIIYGLCSLTLLYSGLIVRDIVLAFFYAVCIETVLKPFKLRNIFLLLILMAVCIGIRLFSGFYVIAFILYYLFFNIKGKLIKVFLYPLMGIAILGVGATVFVQDMMEKTSEEVEGYNQWQSDEATQHEGFSSSIRKLPAGINYIALFLFSQMNPFPPYSNFLTDKLSLAQSYMAALMMVTSIWWYFISYSLIFIFFLRKGYKSLGFQYDCLLFIAWILIIVSSAMHVDIRRIMPVYPIIYYLYLYCKNYLYSQSQTQYINDTLSRVYIALNLLYIIIK